MPNELTHKYISPIQQREPNLFVEEYYCSTDTKIVIDDIEQTEIAYINYALQEQLKPLYGYASNTFDDVAIGNRIVTGMFKVPIKNPEAQATIDMVYAEGSGDSEANTYNESQDSLKDAIEWINNNGSGTTTGSDENTTSDYAQDMSDDLYDYMLKLASLGYKVNKNSTYAEFEKALRQFQLDNQIDLDNGLNWYTKEKIDKACEMGSGELEKINLPSGTVVYAAPNASVSMQILNEEHTATVVDESIKGWKFIILDNNNSYWIIG